MEICVDADAARTVGACQSVAFNNGAGRVEFVRWGAQHVAAFTSGFFRLDDFDSRRVGNIGL